MFYCIWGRGGTNLILRIKEQETRLNLPEHDDDDYDDDYDYDYDDYGDDVYVEEALVP